MMHSESQWAYDQALASSRASELVQLNKELDDARVELSQRRLELKQGTDSNSAQSRQMREANEQLVMAALQAREDVESSTHALNEAARQSGLDSLTGLPNRVLMLDRLSHAMALSLRHGTRLALIFVDLDGFKQINDSLGHAIGDEVLRVAAQTMVASVRTADTVSRHGGDEFLILLSDVVEPTDAKSVADLVLASLSVPRAIGKHVLQLTASAGISIFPDDGGTPDELIDRADTAMYHAKRQAPGGSGRYRAVAENGAAQTASTAPAPALLNTQREIERAENDRSNGKLREANDRLVRVALAAQFSQKAAEEALRWQTQANAETVHEMHALLSPIHRETGVFGMRQADVTRLDRAIRIVDRQVSEIADLASRLQSARPDNADQVELRRDFNLNVVILACAEHSRLALEARQQLLAVDLPTHAPLVHADPIRVGQLLDDLLILASNAAPFGDTLHLKVDVIDRLATMSLSHAVIGTPPEPTPTVLDVFAQTDGGVPSAETLNTGGSREFAEFRIERSIVRDVMKAHYQSMRRSGAHDRHQAAVAVKLPLAIGRSNDNGE